MIPFQSGLIVLSALHTLTHTLPVESAWPGSKPRSRTRAREQSSSFAAAQWLRLLLFFRHPSRGDGSGYRFTRSGMPFGEAPLGLFLYGNSCVNFRRGVGNSLIIGREAQGYSTLNLVRLSGFLLIWVVGLGTGSLCRFLGHFTCISLLKCLCVTSPTWLM